MLLAAPRKGPPRRHRRPARLALVGGAGRDEAIEGRRRRAERPVSRTAVRTVRPHTSRPARPRPRAGTTSRPRRPTTTFPSRSDDGTEETATTSAHRPDHRTRQAEELPLLPGQGAEIDYKNIAQLRRYISEKGKIRSRRITGACRRHQIQVAVGGEARAGDGPPPVRRLGIGTLMQIIPLSPGRREAGPAWGRRRRRPRLRAELPPSSAAGRDRDPRAGGRAAQGRRRAREARGAQRRAGRRRSRSSSARRCCGSR